MAFSAFSTMPACSFNDVVVTIRAPTNLLDEPAAEVGMELQARLLGENVYQARDGIATDNEVDVGVCTRC